MKTINLKLLALAFMTITTTVPAIAQEEHAHDAHPVSYTHLTLPTNREV